MTFVVERSEPSALRRSGLARLLDGNAVTMMVVAAIVPNILFAIISPWFLLRRMLSPLVYVVAAMLAVFVPWPVAVLVFAVAAALDAFFIIAFLFDMAVQTTLQALQYAGEINIHASMLYVGAISYFVVLVLLLTYLAHRYKEQMRRASPLLAASVAVSVGIADFNLNGYKPLARPAFESAMGENHLTAESILARNRNLLVVIVEGMGAFADPSERHLLSGRLAAAAAGRFAMTTGTSNYYGSTTGAEARELCGVWGTYVEFGRNEISNCLPEKLAQAGYRTVSYHAAGSKLFSRRSWYPVIGIQETNFREDIERERPEAIKGRCGSVFFGM
jgi:hypothetical protein